MKMVNQPKRAVQAMLIALCAALAPVCAASLDTGDCVHDCAAFVQLGDQMVVVWKDSAAQIKDVFPLGAATQAEKFGWRLVQSDIDTGDCVADCSTLVFLGPKATVVSRGATGEMTRVFFPHPVSADERGRQEVAAADGRTPVRALMGGGGTGPGDPECPTIIVVDVLKCHCTAEEVIWHVETRHEDCYGNVIYSTIRRTAYQGIC